MERELELTVNEQENLVCPASNERRTTPKDLSTPDARITQDAEGVWHIHGYDEARQILRSELVRQAGFLAEQVLKDAGSVLKNPPILYLEGDEHHRMRRETNKFFTVAITDRQYRDFMETFADELIERLKREGGADLSKLTMEMAMRVAAQIVGLTDSMLPGLNRRLSGMLDTASHMSSAMPNVINLILSQKDVLLFLLLDVKPAIRARRRQPKNDVISYLISRDYSDIEILTECVVYGVAGMVTTREFIAVALWHLLENPALRERMLVGEQDERYAILHEILRLEPVVGHLLRRTTAPVEIESAGQTVTIPAGTLVNLNIYATNADPQMAGDNALSVCPMRPLTSEQGKVPASVLSFGDGYHRCPGAFVAIQESDIMLRKLLAIDTLRIEREPDISYSEVVKGYELRNFRIVVD